MSTARVTRFISAFLLAAITYILIIIQEENLVNNFNADFIKQDTQEKGRKGTAKNQDTGSRSTDKTFGRFQCSRENTQPSSC